MPVLKDDCAESEWSLVAADCKRHDGRNNSGVWQKWIKREYCLKVFRAMTEIGIFGAALRFCHIAYNLFKSSENWKTFGEYTVASKFDYTVLILIWISGK